RLSKTDIPPAYTSILGGACPEDPSLRPKFKELKSDSINNQGKVDLRNFQPFSRFSRRMNIAEHVFKMVEDYSCRLEEQLKTRMEETAVEKRKRPSHSAYAVLVSRLPTRLEDSFLLLQNFDQQHWLVVVEALKAGVAVTPETYDEVSIYISEIGGFTTTSAMSTPLQFVGLLNDLYTLFYETIANYDIHKCAKRSAD
ncbi:Retinal guanylyl cyclase 2, partial [Taenia solium]